MKCFLDHSGSCSGKAGPYLNGHKNLCRYHGELVIKLQAMNLLQLENLATKAKVSLYVEDARKLALCSTITEFHKHAEDIYTGKYDYTQH